MSARTEVPDNTAVRTALWRALHVEVDAAPPVLDDVIGLQLAAPDGDWRDRADMHPDGTRGFRASIVARARFIDDLVTEQAAAGVDQYVILGAGLDTLAQRRPDLGAGAGIFEVDQPGTQAWKRRRLDELGYGVPDWLRLVPIDFECPARAGGTGSSPPASTPTACGRGVHRRQHVPLRGGHRGDAASAHRARARLDGRDDVPAPGRARRRGRPTGPRDERPGRRASGTPFVSFYPPDEIVGLACRAGFRDARHISSSTLADRWFAGRADGLRPSTGEDLLLATT